LSKGDREGRGGRKRGSWNEATEGRGGRGWVRGMWKGGREGQRGEYSKKVHVRGGGGGEW
jgi:hypothetical protein